MNCENDVAVPLKDRLRILRDSQYIKGVDMTMAAMKSHMTVPTIRTYMDGKITNEDFAEKLCNYLEKVMELNMENEHAKLELEW